MQFLYVLSFLWFVHSIRCGGGGKKPVVEDLSWANEPIPVSELNAFNLRELRLKFFMKNSNRYFSRALMWVPNNYYDVYDGNYGGLPCKIILDVDRIVEDFWTTPRGLPRDAARGYVSCSEAKIIHTNGMILPRPLSTDIEFFPQFEFYIRPSVMTRLRNRYVALKSEVCFSPNYMLQKERIMAEKIWAQEQKSHRNSTSNMSRMSSKTSLRSENNTNNGKTIVSRSRIPREILCCEHQRNHYTQSKY